MGRFVFSPVIVVFSEQRVPIKPSRIEAAHVPVGQGSTVQDIAGLHICKFLVHDRYIDPFWNRPHFFRNKTKLDRRFGQSKNRSLEEFRKGFIVEEYVWILEIAIEAAKKESYDVSNRIIMLHVS